MEFYKIYYDHKKVIIADEADLNFNGNNTLFAEFDNAEILKALIRTLLEVPSIESLYIYGEKPELIWETYKSLYTIIEAAGGLVLNKASHALLIFRHQKWDLPKGKIEKKETIEQAAIREVIEECGVKDLVIDEKLCITYHVYDLNDKKILKFSHWFLMRCQDNEPELVPQIIEGITDAKWMTATETLNILDQSYSSVRDVLTRFFIKSL
jgi:ADP-ribose pyrophosphatase YjhB (NUDIX family)